MRWVLVLLALAVSGCAVKGYDLGWRHDGPLTPLLGLPLDGLSACQWASDGSGSDPGCEALALDVNRVLAAQPPRPQTIQGLGGRCRGTICTYANTYDRRDVGLAAVIPVYKRVTLREVRMRFALNDGSFSLQALTVRDNAPPGYGPVWVGASP